MGKLMPDKSFKDEEEEDVNFDDLPNRPYPDDEEEEDFNF